MTRIQEHKPVTRETAVEDQGRPLIVVLYHKHMVFRFRGTKWAGLMTYNEALECIHRRDSTPTMAKYRGRD